MVDHEQHLLGGWCKQCGVVSNHTPKHFQQMECLCDDCYTAQYVATEELE